MANPRYTDLFEQQPVLRCLHQSIANRRLGHAYLFSGAPVSKLEEGALAVAEMLICPQAATGPPCGQCSHCRRIAAGEHPDVHWVRPASKSRVITIDQMRELLRQIQLRPHEAPYKVGIISAADRLNPQAANAFLKTLEEPPDRSILLLLSADPQQILETLVSRCQRLVFSAEHSLATPPAAWLEQFAAQAGAAAVGVLARYRLMGNLFTELSHRRELIEKQLADSSPLARYDDLDPRLREQWEDELSAATEAEYRRQRSEVLGHLQAWFRDIWLHALGCFDELLAFPSLAPAARSVATRISPADATRNLTLLEDVLRLLLNSNVQESLALEVAFLKLKF